MMPPRRLLEGGTAPKRTLAQAATKVRFEPTVTYAARPTDDCMLRKTAVDGVDYVTNANLPQLRRKDGPFPKAAIHGVSQEI